MIKPREQLAEEIKVNATDVRNAVLDELEEAIKQIQIDHPLASEYASDARYTWPDRWAQLQEKLRSMREVKDEGKNLKDGMPTYASQNRLEILKKFFGSDRNRFWDFQGEEIVQIIDAPIQELIDETD
jgi:hypothetical protein